MTEAEHAALAATVRSAFWSARSAVVQLERHGYTAEAADMERLKNELGERLYLVEKHLPAGSGGAATS